jgi:hypothetical protein
MCIAIISSSALRNSALSLGSDRRAGDKGGERSVVGLDLGQGHLTCSTANEPSSEINATTAYDIIRQCGVEIGKRDFMGAPPS